MRKMLLGSACLEGRTGCGVDRNQTVRKSGKRAACTNVERMGQLNRSLKLQ